MVQARERIDILVYAAVFLHEEYPRLNELLTERAAEGCTVRVAIADADSGNVQARGQEERFGHGEMVSCVRTRDRIGRGVPFESLRIRESGVLVVVPGEGRCRADLVEALADGTGRDAESIVAGHPEVTRLIASWIREAARAGNWTRVDRFANLAAPLRAPGLGGVLQEILDSDAVGFNKEDLVEILGEIRETDAVPCLFRVAEGSVDEDAPAYWLCQKVVCSLGEIGTPEARERLRRMTDPAWPDVVRWHAAAELGVEDELGFDEDQMLG